MGSGSRGDRASENRGPASGGEARLSRQRDRGRLNARERVTGLFDPGSFFEIGQLVGTTDEPPVPGDALVAGSGRINGRPTIVADFSSSAKWPASRACTSAPGPRLATGGPGADWPIGTRSNPC